MAGGRMSIKDPRRELNTQYVSNDGLALTTPFIELSFQPAWRLIECEEKEREKIRMTRGI